MGSYIDSKKREKGRIFTTEKGFKKAIGRYLWEQIKKVLYVAFALYSSFALTSMIIGAGYYEEIGVFLIIFINYLSCFWLVSIFRMIKEQEEKE